MNITRFSEEMKNFLLDFYNDENHLRNDLRRTKLYFDFIIVECLERMENLTQEGKMEEGFYLEICNTLKEINGEKHYFILLMVVKRLRLKSLKLYNNEFNEDENPFN